MTQVELKSLYENSKENIYLICNLSKYEVVKLKWTGKYIDYTYDFCGEKRVIKNVPEVIVYKEDKGEREYEKYSALNVVGATTWWFFNEKDANVQLEEIKKVLE